MTNFEGAMEHFKVSYPFINAELLASYFSALVAQGVLPVPKKTIKGVFILWFDTWPQLFKEQTTLSTG